MTQQHPITPPPELVYRLQDLGNLDAIELAYQAGADQELDACCKWLYEWTLDKHPGGVSNLRTARRPKTLSKKERALDSLLKCYAFIDDDLYNEIKEAIQSLPDEQ